MIISKSKIFLKEKNTKASWINTRISNPRASCGDLNDWLGFLFYGHILMNNNKYITKNTVDNHDLLLSSKNSIFGPASELSN